MCLNFTMYSIVKASSPVWLTWPLQVISIDNQIKFIPTIKFLGFFPEHGIVLTIAQLLKTFSFFSQVFQLKVISTMSVIHNISFSDISLVSSSHELRKFLFHVTLIIKQKEILFTFYSALRTPLILRCRLIFFFSWQSFLIHLYDTNRSTKKIQKKTQEKKKKKQKTWIRDKLDVPLISKEKSLSSVPHFHTHRHLFSLHLFHH